MRWLWLRWKLMVGRTLLPSRRTDDVGERAEEEEEKEENLTTRRCWVQLGRGRERGS